MHGQTRKAEEVSQATPEIRRELLRVINAPAGAVTIARRIAKGGDEIVVYLAPGVRLPKDRMPNPFRGVTVRYETRKPAKAYA